MDSLSSENIFYFKQEDLLIKSMPILQELRKTGLFCDVVVKAGDQEFSAHRIILIATIPYFQAMFTSEYVESKQKEVVIKDVHPSSLETLIDFSYSGIIQIDHQNVLKLIKVADFFQLNQVKNACADFLTSKIDVKNVFEIKKLSNLLNSQQLVAAADEFLKENFSKIAESDDFLMLELEEIIELIEKDGITCSEEEVFETAMKWVKHKKDERKSLLPEILPKVQLPLVSTEYLVNVVSTEELIWSSLECLRIVDKAKNDRLKKFPKKSRGLPKFGSFVPIISENQLKIYDVNKKEWLNEVPLHENRSKSAVVSFENKIYVIGSDSSNVDIYDLETKIWSKGENMINGRSYFSATVLNDCIYVFGGNQRSTAVSSVECYSIKENIWKAVASMNTQRRRLVVTSLNGYIYAIGGYNNNIGNLNICEKYDPTSNTWTNIKPLSCTRFDAGVGTLNNKIYVCGGYGNGCLNSCEVYDPSTDTWSILASMNEKRQKLSLSSVSGKLFAVGGLNETGEVSSVEIYSPETNSWELLH